MRDSLRALRVEKATEYVRFEAINFHIIVFGNKIFDGSV
jgi:hypothetical protein